MERFPVELLYVLGFIAFMLFNFMAQRAAQRRQQEEQALAPAEEAQAGPAPAADEPLEDIWGRTPAPAPLAAPPLAAPPPFTRAEARPPRRVHPVRALLKDRRDLRRAVALMMVLEPCRAQQPPEQR